jgi:WD40 repeat protein
VAVALSVAGTVEGRVVNSCGAVVVWNVESGKVVFKQSTREPLRAVAFDHTGTLVVAGGDAAGGRVIGWNLASGAEVLSLRGHSRPILALAIGPDGRLATAGADRVVKVWDQSSGRETITLDEFAREVTHVAFTSDGKALVAGTGFDLLSPLAAGAGIPNDLPPVEVKVFRGPK